MFAPGFSLAFGFSGGGGAVGGGDVTPPVLQSAVIDETEITLTYDEALNPASVPTLTLAGTDSVVSSVDVTGVTVVGTLDTPPFLGETITVSSSGAPIEDLAGNDAAALSGEPVTNNSEETPAQEHDVRNLGLGAKLWRFWESRPEVTGAAASLTVGSGTLRGTGSASPPTVTMTGPLATRQVVITYLVGGARGTATYVIDLGNGCLYGTTSATPVDIGGGNAIEFGTGTYVATTPAGGHTHQLVVTSWVDLVASSALTSTLIGAGTRYEALGLNGTSPALYFLNSCLANETDVPALVTGTDVDFEVWTVREAWKHISGTGAMIPWAFSNQTDTTKSYIRGVMGGPTNSGKESRIAIMKRDSGGTPATVEHISNNCYSDLEPHVMREIVSATGQQWVDGMPSRVSAGSPQSSNLHRGVATTLDRFTVGHIKLGTSAFSTSNPFNGRVSAIVITAPLSDAEALSLFQALS